MGEGSGELLLKQYGTSVWDEEKVLELDGDDGYTTVQMCKYHQNVGLMWFNGKFCHKHLPQSILKVTGNCFIQRTWVSSKECKNSTVTPVHINLHSQLSL